MKKGITILKWALFTLSFTAWLMVYPAHPVEMIGSASGITYAMEGEDYITKVIYKTEILNQSGKDSYVVFYCEAKDKDGKIIETRANDEEVKTFVIKAGETENFSVTFSFRNLIGKAFYYTTHTKQIEPIIL